MALTRAQFVTTLAGQWGEVLSLAGVDATDVTGAMKEPVDQAFRALDTAEADLATASVATGSEEKGLAYGSYYLLVKCWQAVARKMNMGSAGAKADLAQQYDHVKELLGHALATAQRWGLSVPGEGFSGVYPLAYVGGTTDVNRAAADALRSDPLFSIDNLRLVPDLGELE